jgi:two-component system chemotaxis response regulator CheB
MPYEIVVIGTSAGGLAALRELIGGLPARFALPVVVVQHRHRDSDASIAALLQERTPLPVCEVEDKAPIVRGHVHVAPADYHLLIEDGYFSLAVDAPVGHSRPSIDVTFASAADAYGDRAAGVVLTGANADGSAGLRRIDERHGLAFVQDPATAESPAMPLAAIRAVPHARVLAIGEIARALAALPAWPATASRDARRPSPPRAADSDSRPEAR